MNSKAAQILLLLFLSAEISIAQVSFHVYQHDDKFALDPWFRYNKAEGIFSGLAGYYFANEDLTFSGRLGYGWSSEKIRYRFGAKQVLPAGNNEYIMEAAYFLTTSSSDAHILPDWQNSVTALFFKADFYNHYELHGGHLQLGKNWGDTYQILVQLGLERYGNSRNKIGFSLFDWLGDKQGGRRKFLQSPAVAKGSDYYFQLSYHLDTRPSPLVFLNGWTLEASYRNSDLLKDVTSSDFSYERLKLNVKRFQQTWGRQRFSVGLSLASHKGATTFTSDSLVMAADQFLFDIGGLNTLRGYRYREFTDGNRVALFQLDYYFNGDFLPRTPLRGLWGLGWIFRSFDLVLFSDLGMLQSVSNSKTPIYFKSPESDDVMVNVGLGLALRTFVRIDFAVPLKDGLKSRRGDLQMSLRIQQSL